MAVVAVFAHYHLIDHRHKFYIRLPQDLVQLFITFVLVRRVLSLNYHLTRRYL